MTPSSLDIVIIGGFGHVGLPLGISLANAGFQTGLIDTNTALRPRIEAGEMPFIEYDAEPMLKKTIGKTLHVCELADVAKARIVIVTIGTPVDEYLSPKLRPLFALADTLLPHLHRDQCILLRSTVSPGSSRFLHEYFRTHDKPVHVAFCPERIVQGYAIKELKTLPQIISGFSPEALAMSREIFEKLGVETIAVEPEEAEFSKLFLNAWRYIQFAVGNQFYTIAADRGLDYERIYDAMTHHYDRARDLPKPGFAAGPCLLKDTMQLSAAARSQFVLGHAAMMVNEGLPAFIVDQLRRRVDLHGKTVGILGMAFKAEIDDPRDALSYKLRKLLKFHGADVLCSDEYIADVSFTKRDDLVKKSDIIIVGVPHKAYKTLKVPAKKEIIDLWGVLPKAA